MIEDARGNIDYDEQGSGPTIVFVPGSWGTRSAWRGVIAALDKPFRVVTTSLLGYGGTQERRTATDLSMERQAEIIEAVARRAGGTVHLVGHSFGGLACPRRGHARNDQDRQPASRSSPWPSGCSPAAASMR